jgi:hypothetical protein
VWASFTALCKGVILEKEKVTANFLVIRLTVGVRRVREQRRCAQHEAGTFQSSRIVSRRRALESFALVKRDLFAFAEALPALSQIITTTLRWFACPMMIPFRGYETCCPFGPRIKQAGFDSEFI